MITVSPCSFCRNRIPSANHTVIRRRPHHRDSTDPHYQQQQGVTVTGRSAFQFGYSLFQVHASSSFALAGENPNSRWKFVISVIT